MRSATAAFLLPFLLAAGLFLLFASPLVRAIETAQLAPSSQPDLIVNTYISGGSDSPAPGNIVEYQIYFLNWGSSVANDVYILFILPQNTSYVECSHPGFALVQTDPTQVRLYRRSLTVFERGWLSVKVRIDDDAPVGAPLLGEASIWSLDSESNWDDNESSVLRHVVPTQTDLAVAIHHTAEGVAAGEELTYRVSYANMGSVDAANAAITVTLPTSTTYVSSADSADFSVEITGNVVVWTAPVVPRQNWYFKEGHGDLFVTAQIDDDCPAEGWLTALSEISTTDSESEYKNNRKRLTLKPDHDKHYGAAVTSLDDDTMLLLNEGGFDWMLYYLDWSVAEPANDTYDWSNLDHAVWQAWWYNMDLIVRVNRSPGWARGPGDASAPPTNPQNLDDFMHVLAARWPRQPGNPSAPQIHGYQIWNEPNLASEWGGNAPSAAVYKALLQEGYEGVNAGSPDAWVISAGLAPTLDDAPGAVDDRTYLQQLYTAGAAPYFDYMGVHPLGFAVGPDDETDPNGFQFRRAEEWRAIMQSNGDGSKQMWATEVGWLRNSSVDLSGYNWMKVSTIDQAHFLGRAYHKARLEWPWMGPMMTWNLDFASHYADTQHEHWFSVTDDSHNPRRAWKTLSNSATLGPPDFWLQMHRIGDIEPSATITYVIDYANIGGQPATSVTLTDTMPAGAVFVSDSRGDGVVANGEVLWDIGTVPMGAREVVTLTLQLSDSPGALVANTADIGIQPNEPFIDDNAVTLSAHLPDLRVTKRAEPSALSPGAPISFTIDYANDGLAAARNVSIRDVIPPQLTNLSYQTSEPTIPLVGAPPYGWGVGDLQPSEGGTITVSGTLVDDVSLVNTSFTNSVEITSTSLEGQPSTNHDELVVNILDVRVTGLTAANDGPAFAGQPIAFMASVTGGTNIRYKWLFGDGAKAWGADVSHTYTSPGQYTARVEAMNSAGKVMASTAVRVQHQTVTPSPSPTPDPDATPEPVYFPLIQ